MLRDVELLFLVFTVGTVFVHLTTPTGGAVFVAGDSMDPAIPGGCSLVAAQSWDGESSLEGDVVAFDSEHIETDVVGGSVVNAEPWVAHRVVAEYETYDADEADHYVDATGRLVADTRDGYRVMRSDQDYDDVTALEGERVLVLKGDNNNEIDPALIHEDEVLGVLSEDAYLTLQDGGSWPCSAIA